MFLAYHVPFSWHECHARLYTCLCTGICAHACAYVHTHVCTWACAWLHVSVRIALRHICDNVYFFLRMSAWPAHMFVAHVFCARACTHVRAHMSVHITVHMPAHMPVHIMTVHMSAHMPVHMTRISAFEEKNHLSGTSGKKVRLQFCWRTLPVCSLAWLLSTQVRWAARVITT